MMKKTKKRLTRLFAVCVCMIIVLSACASTDVDAPSGEKEATEESKATSALELSDINAEGTSSETEPSDESSESEPSTPEGHISADDEASIPGDITITPIEPTYPEERETTLEFVREYPLGEDGIPFYLLYENDPEYAQIVTPDSFLMDKNGELYAYVSGCVYDIQTSERIRIDKRNNPIISLYMYNGKIYSTAIDGTLNTHSFEKGLESSVKIADGWSEGVLYVHPSADGTPLVNDGLRFYGAKGEEVSCDYLLSSGGGITVGQVDFSLKDNDNLLFLSDLDNVLTFQEHDYASYPSRAWVDEYIFYQFDAMSTPVSEFAVYQLWSPENLPCNMIAEDVVCKWYRGMDVLIGKQLFEDVLSARYFMGADNQLYAMIVYPDRAELYRINPGYSDVTPIDFDKMGEPADSPEIWGEVFGANAFSVSERTVAETAATTATTITHIDFSPLEVYARADAMCEMTWTLQAGHKNTNGCRCNDVTHAIQLPRYLSSAVNGQEMTGIPYCWGGFNGIDAVSSGIYSTSFLNAITRTDSNGDLYITGNINSNPIGSNNGHCDFTIGLDCSGFVSSAYGLTSKHSVSTLDEVGHQKNKHRRFDFDGCFVIYFRK